ncbi:MAG: hypothetical protein AAFS10_27310, partial [Myxococcota bacterium]
MDYNVRVAEVLRTLSRAGDVAAAKPLGFSQQVAQVALTLARRLDTPAEHHGSLLLAGLLHGIGWAAIAPQLARTLNMDERPILAHFPTDVVMGMVGQSGSADDDHDTHVFLRHLLYVGRAPEIAQMWLSQSGLSTEGTWIGALMERHDGSGIPRGIKGHQLPQEARVLAVAWLLASVRQLASQAHPGEPLAVQAAELLGDERWITNLSGRTFDPAVAVAAAQLWGDAAFWDSVALRARTELANSLLPDDDVITNEALASSVAPSTAEAEVPQTQERPVVVRLGRSERVEGYIRGRHDVDEDVADTDRHIDDVLYPRFGAFLEPTAPWLEVWLGLMSNMADAKDGFPEGHSATVVQLCQDLGLALGLDDGSLRALVLAARVYRIGRLCLSSALLSTKVRLNEIQRQQLESHFGTLSWHCLLAGYGAFPPTAANQPGRGDHYVEKGVPAF